jgi:hypothetical protein
VLLQVALRSTDGTSVTATLDYVEALLAYDVAIVGNGRVDDLLHEDDLPRPAGICTRRVAQSSQDC